MRWSNLAAISLSTRITVGALAFLILGALGLMFYEGTRRHDLFINERRADLSEALEVNDIRLRQAMEHLRRDVQFLARTPPASGIIRATRNHGHDPRDDNSLAAWKLRLEQIFTAFAGARPDYHQVSFLGNDELGRELVRVNQLRGQIKIVPPAELQNRADRDYFQAARQLRPHEIHLSSVDLHRERGMIARPAIRAIHALAPVFAEDGELFGLMVIGMNIDPLLQSAATGLPAGVTTYISNQAGHYLLHPETRRAFAFEEGDNHAISHDFPLLGGLLTLEGPQTLPLQVVAADSSRAYLAASRIHYDPDNPANFLLLAYQISGSSAKMVARIPRFQIIASLLGLFLVGAGVFVMLRRTFAPLAQLTVTAEEISSGKEYFELPHTQHGEIGTLTKAFGSMLNELSRREQEIIRNNERLEQQVAERTRDLTSANERLAEEMAEREQALARAEELLRRHQVIIETAQAGFWLADRNGVLLEANQAYAAMSGYTVAELVGMHISQLEAQEQSKEEVMAHIAQLIREGYERFETRHRRKDGREIDIEVSVTYLPETEQFFVFCEDITQRKQAEAEIHALAFYDPLTRLANRRLFLDHLKSALAASARHADDCGALFFIDMDRFKIVNDTWGHECGDAMLIEVAARIKATLRDQDLAARFGGDEFVVLIQELGPDLGEAERKARRVAEKLRSALARPYTLNDHLHHSSPSIGVGLFHGQAEGPESLLQRADQAMYAAKSAGRNTIRFYDSPLLGSNPPPRMGSER